MIVLFRSCETNSSPGSLSDGSEVKPRWNGKYKQEILRKCYMSIQPGITKSDTIIIINDNTSNDTLDWMEDNTVARFYVVNITPLSELREQHNYPIYHPVVANSCEELMELLITVAEENINELIYVCEDDYLHKPNAIVNMKKLYDLGYDGFYLPYDYPDRYTLDRSRTCDLFLGPTSHLRTVPSGTLTMATLGKTWLQYKFELLRAGVFADDTWTYKAFKNSQAYCPVPGEATHLQEHCITPIINWSKIYDDIQTS